MKISSLQETLTLYRGKGHRRFGRNRKRRAASQGWGITPPEARELRIFASRGTSHINLLARSYDGIRLALLTFGTRAPTALPGVVPPDDYPSRPALRWGAGLNNRQSGKTRNRMAGLWTAEELSAIIGSMIDRSEDSS